MELLQIKINTSKKSKSTKFISHRSLKVKIKLFLSILFKILYISNFQKALAFEN